MRSNSGRQDEAKKASEKGVSEQNSLVISAAFVALGVLSSRVLGLLRDMMTARYFGNDVRDAWIAAFRLPNVFRRVMSEGSLSVSFIPVFVEVLTGKGLRGSESGEAADSQVRARQLVSATFSVLLSVTISLSLLAVLYMEDIMTLLLRGEAFRSVPGKFEMTVQLGRIMFGFLILISVYAFLMAILQSLKKFALAAFAPCLFNIVMIAAAILSPRVAAPELVLAWAVIVGGVFQVVVLVPAVVRSGFLPRLTLNWKSSEIGQVFKSAIPGMLGMSILQVTTLVNMSFASRLPAGSISYLYFADRILELPLSLFAVSIGSAMLPTLAAFWSTSDRSSMSTAINHYLRLVLFVAFPAALGMFVLAQPICEVLFMGREFKYADALITASVLEVYAFTVIVASFVRILAQGFYAIKNTSFPAVAALVSLVAHLLFAYTFTAQFGIQGLACASLASATVNLVLLATAYSAWIGSLQWRALLKSGGKFLVCGVMMVLALQAYQPLLHAIGGRLISRSFVLGSVIGLGAGVYLLTAFLMRLPELHETLETFKSKFAARMSARRSGKRG